MAKTFDDLVRERTGGSQSSGKKVKTFDDLIKERGVESFKFVDPAVREQERFKIDKKLGVMEQRLSPDAAVQNSYADYTNTYDQNAYSDSSASVRTEPLPVPKYNSPASQVIKAIDEGTGKIDRVSGMQFKPSDKFEYNSPVGQMLNIINDDIAEGRQSSLPHLAPQQKPQDVGIYNKISALLQTGELPKNLNTPKDVYKLDTKISPIAESKNNYYYYVDDSNRLFSIPKNEVSDKQLSQSEIDTIKANKQKELQSNDEMSAVAKFFDRIGTAAVKTQLGGEKIAASTGNKIADMVADTVGSVLGIVGPSPNVPMPGGGGISQLSGMGGDISTNILAQITSKLPVGTLDKLPTVFKNAMYGAIGKAASFGTMGIYSSMANDKAPVEAAKDIGTRALIGGVSGGLMNALPESLVKSLEKSEIGRAALRGTPSALTYGGFGAVEVVEKNAEINKQLKEIYKQVEEGKVSKEDARQSIEALVNEKYSPGEMLGHILQQAATGFLVENAMHGLQKTGEWAKKGYDKTVKGIQLKYNVFKNRNVKDLVPYYTNVIRDDSFNPAENGYVEFKNRPGIWVKYDPNSGELIDQYYEMATVTLANGEIKTMPLYKVKGYEGQPTAEVSLSETPQQAPSPTSADSTAQPQQEQPVSTTDMVPAQSAETPQQQTSPGMAAVKPEHVSVNPTATSPVELAGQVKQTNTERTVDNNIAPPSEDIDNRTYEDVSDRKAKSIQNDYPELKPHIQSEADRLLKDLNNTIKGERFVTTDEHGEMHITGTRREASPSIERILDMQPRPTYDAIRDALQRIVGDHGRENTALAKRIELVIDDNLTKGTKDFMGNDIVPNQEYISAKHNHSDLQSDTSTGDGSDLPMPGEFIKTPKPVDNIASKPVETSTKNDNEKSTSMPKQEAGEPLNITTAGLNKELSGLIESDSTIYNAVKNNDKQNALIEIENRQIYHANQMLSKYAGKIDGGLLRHISEFADKKSISEQRTNKIYEDILKKIENESKIDTKQQNGDNIKVDGKDRKGGDNNVETGKADKPEGNKGIPSRQDDGATEGNGKGDTGLSEGKLSERAKENDNETLGDIARGQNQKGDNGREPDRPLPDKNASGGELQPKPSETSNNTDRDVASDGQSVKGTSDGAGNRGIEYKSQIQTNKNYRVVDADSVFTKGGKKTRYKANVDALNTLLKLLEETRQATPEEQSILAKFSGWGALPEVFDYTGWGANERPKHENWSKEFYELKDVFKKLSEYIKSSDSLHYSARRSTLNAHFTSPQIISNIYKILGKLGFKHGSILEPSMGIGNFFGLLPENILSKSRLYGVELDPVTGNIARLLYPGADIRIQGYQETTYPDNFFDVAVGNVPFGDIKIYDRTYKQDYQTSKIHNYFFVKTLDKVKPGGVVAFITSTGTMDAKTSNNFRKYVSNKANLIAAIRLPNDTFKDNAGTDVTSDLIILQKLQEGELPKNDTWVETGEYEINGKMFSLNQYYINNPHMMLGELVEDTLYGSGGRLALVNKSGDIQELLNKIIDENIPKGIFNQHSKPQVQQPSPIVLEGTDDIKEGTFFKKDGEIYRKKNGEIKPIGKNKDAISRLIDIKELAKSVISMQTDRDIDEKAIEAERNKLKKIYDSYVKKYGRILKRERKEDNTLSSPFINNILSGDPELYIYRSLEIEKINDNNEQEIKEALIFTQRTYTPYKPIDKVDNASDGLIASMNDLGYVDIEHIEKIYGKTEDEIIEELGDKIYKNPIGGYESADEYLSGNVRKKLIEAEEAVKLDITYTKNVEALRKVQPETVSIVDVDIKLGESWVPIEYTKNAIASLFDLRRSDEFNLTYSPADASWSLTTGRNLSYTVAMRQLGVEGVCNALEVVRKALNNSSTNVYDEYKDIDGKVQKVLNKDKTLELRQKVEQVSNYFKEWVMNDAEVAKEIESLYNDTFNVFVAREYGEISKHMSFPNMNPFFQEHLYEHQRNAIARAVYGGSTLFAHAVGSGKTFAEIAAAMEYKRLGLSSKPVLVVPNNKLGDYERDFRILYPGANILALNEDDFASRSIKETLVTAATNDWDCVIIRHSSFTKIPVGSDLQRTFIEQQIHEAELALAGDSGNDFNTKKLIKKIDQLKEKLEATLQNRATYDMLTFEEIGFDMIIVDEAHEYKNLSVPGKLGSIKGMQVSDAEKTFDMLMKLSYVKSLHNNKRGVIFGTGTPISNSMAELFIMTKYLRPDLLEERNISHFDAWARTFSDVGMSIEVAPKGGFRTTERFKSFTNLPELIKMFREFTDIKLQSDLNLPLPKLEGGKPIIVKCEPHEELANIMKAVEDSWEQAIKDKTVLRLFNTVRTAPVDVRLVNPELKEHEGSKVNNTVKNVAMCYKETEKENGTQIIFLNRGRSNITGFDLYKDLINKLVKAGIPRNEIALVQGTIKQEKLDEIYSKTNKGEIRVLIGSMSKLGTGVNVQERLFAVHEIDVPFRPSDIEQGEGRILRQGNKHYDWNKPVRIYRYVTQGSDEAFSGDSYSWQIIEQKRKNINSVMKGDPSVRKLTVDDDAEDAALMKAIASGNPLMLDKIKLESDIDKLRVERNAFLKTQLRAKQDLKHVEEDIRTGNQWIRYYDRNKSIIEAKPEGDFSIVLGAGKKKEIIGNKGDANKKIEKLISEIRKKQDGDEVLIGKYRGFEIYGVVEDSTASLLVGVGYKERYFITTNKYYDNKYSLGPNYASASDLIGAIDHTIKHLPKLRERAYEKLLNLEKTKTDTLELASKSFAKEDKLNKLTDKLKDVDKKLGIGQIDASNENEDGSDKVDGAKVDTPKKSKKEKPSLSKIEKELGERVGEALNPDEDTEFLGAGFVPPWQKAGRGPGTGSSGQQAYTGFVNPEVEKRWQKAKNETPPMLERVVTRLQEMKETLRNQMFRGAFEYLDRVKYSELRFKLLQFQKSRDIALYKTLKYLQGITVNMTPKQYDVFSRKVALDDLLQEAYAEHRLAFGFEDVDNVKVELDRVDNIVTNDPELQKALSLRTELWEAIKKDYIDIMKSIGFNVEDRLSKKNYYRHLVLDYINSDRVLTGTGKKLRTPTGASYLKKRQGSMRDYVSDYLQAESEVIAQMLFDMEKAKLIEHVDNSEHNILKELKKEAKNINNRAIREIIDAEKVDPKADVDKDGKPISPTEQAFKNIDKRIAMSFNKLETMATGGSLWTGDNNEFENAVYELGNPMSVDSISDDVNEVYKYLSALANTDNDGSLEAATILKYTSKKRAAVKELLGDNYATWENTIPEGYSVWQPREGNAFYMTYSLPEKVAEQLLIEGLEQVGITKDMLKQVVAMGQPYKRMVLPDEVILTLDNMSKNRNDTGLETIAIALTGTWKEWQLISPNRYVKYNIRNISGDADPLFVGNTKVFAYAPQATKDLFDVMFMDRPMTDKLKLWFERGGFQTLLQVQEMGDINKLKMFLHLQEKRGKISQVPTKIWQSYWKAARLTTDFREAILRYAAFLDFLQQCEDGNGRPKNFGASVPEEVMRLKDNADKAFKLSNELLGAYDDISVIGQYIRKRWIPFYSFQEANFTRYARLFKNAIRNDEFMASVGKAAAGAGRKLPFFLLRNIGKFIFGSLFLTSILQASNYLFFKEEEDQLPTSVRSRPHAILGKDSDGNIIYFSRLGALTDLLEWVGLDTPVQDISDILNGRMTIPEKVKEMALAPLNKAIGSGIPLEKTAIEAIVRRSIYPDISNPRSIRDRAEYIANSLGVLDEYKVVAGKPRKPYLQTLVNKAVYRADPLESAYYEILDAKQKFLREHGKGSDSFFYSKKSVALYNYKLSLKYKDADSAIKYLAEYKALGGTARGLRQSLNTMNVWYGIPKELTVKFLQYLTPKEQYKLELAKEYYRNVINTNREFRDSEDKN